MPLSSVLLNRVGADKKTPAPAATPDSQEPSTISKVGNFFSSVGGVAESFGKGLIESTKQAGRFAGDVGGLVLEGVSMGDQAIYNKARNDLIGKEVSAASLLPKPLKNVALSKIGTPSKYFVNESTLGTTVELMKDMGLHPIVNGKANPALEITASPQEEIQNIKVLAPQAINAAVTFSPLLETGGKILEGLKYISPEATSGALVKVAIRDTAEQTAKTSGSVASTVGEKIIQDAGDTARITVRAATNEGKLILPKTAAQKILGNMINTGVINSALSVVNTWSQGNNFDTPEQVTQAFDNAGIAFVQGNFLGLVGGSFQSGIEDVQGRQLINETNAKLGTDYSGEMGVQLAKSIKEIRDTYGAVITESRMQNLTDASDKSFADVRDANLKKATQVKAEKTIARNTAALRDLVSKTPVHSTYDEAVQHLSKNYDMNAIAASPEEQLTSGVKGNKVTFQKGSLPDYLKQVGNFVASKVKDTVPLSAFKDEISKIPDSGVKEMDTAQAKIGRIMGQLNGENAQSFRTDFPKIASAFDAVHGVINKISTTEAAQSFVRDRLPENYSEIESVIQRESTSVRQDPITGKNEIYIDPNKQEKMWLDAQELALGKDGSTAKDVIKKTLGKANEVSDLRSAAQAAGDSNPTLQQAFQKADEAIASVKSLDEKADMWKQHLEIFGIKAPETTDVSSKGASAPEKTMAELQTADTSRDPSQNAIEDALKNKDYTKAQEAVDSIKDPDMKKSMQQVVDFSSGKIGEEDLGKTPETNLGKEKIVSKVSKDIADKALANNIRESLGNLPELDKVNMKEQVERTGELMDSDYQKAIRVASGVESPPDGLLPIVVLKAVEQRANAEGDIDVLRQLANSKTSVDVAKAAQTLQASGLHDIESPVGAIQSVMESRAKAFEGKGGKSVDKSVSDTVSDIRKNITAPAKASVSKFIDDITCK